MTGARDALRRETRDMHDRVDAVYSMFRLDARDGYAAFLTAQAAAHLPCEAALDRAQAERIVPDWPSRRRADLLLDDLRGIGSDVSALDGGAMGVEPSFSTPSEILGAIYVLEGSRLGGAMLVRSVPGSLPRKFLGASVPGSWRTLMQAIDRDLVTATAIDEAVAAARQVFELFERAGRASMRVE
jgi:heme oxygenase